MKGKSVKDKAFRRKTAASTAARTAAIEAARLLGK